MIFEKRVRITMILPAPGTYPMFLAADQAVDSLKEFCGGSSETLDIPPVAKGRWYNMRTHRTVHDDVMIIFGDADIDIDNPNLWQRLNQIKREAQCDLKEEIVWITAHEIKRAEEDDFVM